MLAIVVSHEGIEWLPAVLDALDAQTHRDLDVLLVDNSSSDGSREYAVERLGEDRVLAADRDLGFPGAIAMALDSAAAARSQADWLLFVHDDLALEPDAVERLVEHGLRRSQAAVVGPKLVVFDTPRVLQQVGMSIDVTGRAYSGIEDDEFDQGQHDDPGPALYVSSAGMLVRRDHFEALGGFDRRYHAFGEDLDLCWRTWLAGRDVEVEPAAVGRHVAALATYRRRGRTVGESARYFSERNTLATLLKCYGPARLAVVLPLFFIVGAAKVVGFVATRRVSDVWQTLRAWVWNLGRLWSTLRFRRWTQDIRRRRDVELRPLFIRLVPRIRAYAEAIAERAAGGMRQRVPDPARVDGDPIVRTLRAHPVVFAVAALGVVALVAAAPLLRAGDLRGGDFAAWPGSGLDFLRAYASGWTDLGGTATPEPTSPAQAVLGFVTGLVGGNGWLAGRVILLGAPLVAWAGAYRAAGILTGSPVARVAAASLYALSPPTIAVLTTGDLGGLVMVALLPVLVSAGRWVASTRVGAGAAWRATAAGAIVLAVAIAFEPSLVWIAGTVLVVGIVGVATTRRPFVERRKAVVRLGFVAAGALVLLVPWSAGLFVVPTPLLSEAGAVSGDAAFVRWLVLAPELAGFPPSLVGVAYPASGVLALLVASSRRPLQVGVLWSTVLAGTLAAWVLGRIPGQGIVAPGLVLIVVAAAYTGLLALGIGAAGETLARHAFGWRQVSAMILAVAVSVGILGAVAHLLDDPWKGFDVGIPALPTFLAADQESDGAYRVLVLSQDGPTVRWDVTGPEGPTMLHFGTATPVELASLIDPAVEAMVARTDPAAAARLGLANFRYLYVPEGGRTSELEAALGDQFDLEPLAVEHGLVFRVGRWLPRAVFVDGQTTRALVAQGELPVGADSSPLARVSDDAYEGPVPGPGAIFLGEPVAAGWVAEADGRRLEATTVRGIVRFGVPSAADQVTVHYAAQRTRSVLVALQAGLALLAVSLVLRPPAFVRESARARDRR